MRSFVAIPVPEPVAGRLEDLTAGLDIGTLVPAENMHLTLAFLGDQPRDRLADLDELLGAEKAEAFDLTLDGLGTFGNARPRVLFARAMPNPGLGHLRRAVRRAARDAGIRLAHERYVPHVTLARFGRGLEGEDVAKLQAFIGRRMGHMAATFPATGFSLYESQLGTGGAIYSELASYEL